MTLAEGAGALNVLVDARYRAIESVIPRVIPVSATLSCTGGEDPSIFGCGFQGQAGADF